jgi:hypothetical protein
MPKAVTNPVEDSVPKIDNEVAVGENLEFQRKWWWFEGIVWRVFLVILVCDLLGLFGRGWLASAKRSTPDNMLTVNYERIERASTPSVMTLTFSPAAIHDGRIRVFLSESIVKPLGAQRISPQPLISALSEGGVTYTFPANSAPATAEITLQPSFPGPHKIRIQVPGNDPIDATVFVVP